MEIDARTIAFLKDLAFNSHKENTEYGFFLCLEAESEMIHKCGNIFRGTESEINIPKEVFNKRFIGDERVIGFAHTHPSASCFPSEGDLVFQTEVIFFLGSNFVLLTADASGNVSATYIASREPEPECYFLSYEVFPFILKCLDNAGRTKFFWPGPFEIEMLGCGGGGDFSNPLDEIGDIIRRVIHTDLYEVDCLTIDCNEMAGVESAVIDTEWLAFQLSKRFGDTIILDSDDIANVLENFYNECQRIAMAKDLTKIDNLDFLISLTEVLAVAGLVWDLSKNRPFFYKIIDYTSYLMDDMFMIMVTRTLNSLLSGVRAKLPQWIFKLLPSTRKLVLDLENPRIPFIWCEEFKPIIEHKMK